MSHDAANLERYTVEDWRQVCSTVSLMRRARRRIFAVCTVCALEFQVEFAVIEAIKGPNYSLWSRSHPCVRRYCHGVVSYFVKPPGARSDTASSLAPISLPAASSRETSVCW